MNKLTTTKSAYDFLLLPFFFTALSFYVVYEQATNCLSIGMADLVLRHSNMLAGQSEFFNPWQYRIFSTYLLEGIIVLFDRLPVINQYQYFPYLFLRFIQNLVIFYVAYKFYKALQIESKYLIILGLLLLGYNMSNSVFQSDLSFNTYFDILFYLLAGYLIILNKTIWVLPLMIFASFNRETSVLIAFMVMASAIDFKSRKVKSWFDLKIGIGALLIFVAIFIGLRAYYGMPAAQGIHGMTSPLSYLKFNLAFFRMYPEMFGTLGIIPLLVILKFKSLSYHMKLFLLLIVPIWFLVHFVKSTAVETRLFLVPQALIFIPALLQIIEMEWKKNKIAKDSSPIS